MKKRQLMILLVGVLMLLLCACGKEKNNQRDTGSSSNTENQTDRGKDGDAKETAVKTAEKPVIRINRITNDTMIFYVKDKDISKLDTQNNRDFIATIGVDNFLFELSIHKDDDGSFTSSCIATSTEGSAQIPTSVEELNQLRSGAMSSLYGDTTCYAGESEIFIVYRLMDAETNSLPEGKNCYAGINGNENRQPVFLEVGSEEFTSKDIADQLTSEKYNEKINPSSEKDFAVTTSSSKYFKPDSEDYILRQDKTDSRTQVTLYNFGDSSVYHQCIIACTNGGDLKSMMEGNGYIEDTDGSFPYNTYHEENGVYYVNLSIEGREYEEDGQSKQEILEDLDNSTKDFFYYASKPYLTKAQLVDVYNTQLGRASLGK